MECGARDGWNYARRRYQNRAGSFLDQRLRSPFLPCGKQRLRPTSGLSVRGIPASGRHNRLAGGGQKQAGRAVNALMTLTYWRIGQRIFEQEQRGNQRASYGELVDQLAHDLTADSDEVFRALTFFKCVSFTWLIRLSRHRPDNRWYHRLSRHCLDDWTSFVSFVMVPLCPSSDRG